MSHLRETHNELMNLYSQTKASHSSKSTKPEGLSEESIILRNLHEFVRDDEFDENNKNDCQYH